MNRSKGFRIHQESRMKSHAKRLLLSNHVFTGDRFTVDDIDIMASRCADNYTRCSCHFCRNPRHSSFYNEQEKMTIQERRVVQEPTLERHLT